MPETKKYCTPLPEEVIKISGVEITYGGEFDETLLEKCLDMLPDSELDEPKYEDGPGVPGWEDRSKDIELGITDESAPQAQCETTPKSIGCKVLGDQFIYAIQGLITDLESTKPPGYILAIGKLKGAIIKLQAGD
ncbi:MAG TPA: hypothetical protein VMW50_03430 [Dehalococcoidia bacterium]|nr:hypothetical protein [Dehalococcoidia bacterium]